MNQLTIRGFDDELEKCLRRLASERQISLNRAALALMRRGAGLTERRESPGRVGSSLDSFIGVWTDEDKAELRRVICCTRREDVPVSHPCGEFTV